MIHLRTHQLKRGGDYWTKARAMCGKEVDRSKESTTSNLKVDCPECLRLMMMSLEGELEALGARLETSLARKMRRNLDHSVDAEQLRLF